MVDTRHPTLVILTKEEPVLSAVEGISSPQRVFPVNSTPRQSPTFSQLAVASLALLFNFVILISIDNSGTIVAI
jgi:hypothetical protein